MEKLEPKSIENILALTPLQEGMLFHYLKEPLSGLYFEQLSLGISGEIDVKLFEDAWNVVIETNEMLRTVFRWEKFDKPSQIILTQHSCELKFHDLTAVDSTKKKDALDAIKASDRGEGFDLTQVPFRVILCKLEQNKYEMVISNHHILYDGWSNGIIFKEFFKAYHDLRIGGRSLQFSAKPSFKEFVRWVQSRDRNRQEQFWRDYLSGFETMTELPIKKRAVETASPGEYSIIFEEDINVFVKNNRVTLASVFYTAWGILLQRYCNTNDVIFGTTVSGRSAGIKGIEDIVGLFINTIPLRLQADPFEKISSLIGEVDQVLREREDFESTSLVDIGSFSSAAGSGSLFDTLVIIENYPLDNRLIPENSLLSVTSYSMIEDTHYDLTVSILPFNEIKIKFSFKQELFEKDVIENLACHLKKIIQTIIECPGTVLSQLEIISTEEKNRLLYDFNNTVAEYPLDNLIHQLFEEQVGRTPDNIALVGAGVGEAKKQRREEEKDGGVETLRAPSLPIPIRNLQITYSQLNEQSNQLAGLLIKKGVLADNIIGIMMERYVEMLIGIFGILKSGGAYLPIDPEFPQDRIDYMLTDSAAKLLVTTNNKEVKKVKRWEGEKVFLEEIFNSPKISSYLIRSLPSNFLTSSNLAYVIYTSGTTGHPKGSLIEHRNVVRLMFNDKFQFDFSDRDIWTLFHSFCFDFSVWEMYGALLYGGKLVIVPKMAARDTSEFLGILKKEGVTVLNQTPSAFYNLTNEALSPYQQGRKLYIKYVIFGGEALNTLKLKDWREKYPHIRLINMFGITETTVHVTYKEITDAEIQLNANSIGKPIPTLSVYILDRYLKPVPMGVTGEICVGGKGVCRGYLNRVELTEGKFIENPYKTGERLYRSGDIGRFLVNGDMEYSGRIDQQVKIRGFRIELGEIESQLLSHEQIREVLVMARANDDGYKYLCAYIVPRPPEASVLTKPLKISQLRDYLSGQLPDYMVPTYFVLLEGFPLTDNGKIDRKALPLPGKTVLNGYAQYTAPRDEIEKKLVEIWEDVLGRDVIGINDNFFEMGGDSIKSIQISSRMNKAGYKLKLSDIFQNPTIAKLAPVIETLEQFADQSVVTGIVPLTPIQKWFFHNIVSHRHHFNQAVMFNINERLESGAVKAVFNKLQEHHDALRMTFKELRGEITQTLHGLDYPLSLEEYDLRGIGNPREALEYAANELQASINLETGPMMKLGLFHLNDRDRLLIVIHHLVIDGVSWRILFEDIGSLFRQYKNHETLSLPPKTDSYKAWAEKLPGYADSEVFLREKDYWEKVQTAEFPSLKKDFPGKDNYVKDSQSFYLQLDKEETRLLLTVVNEAFKTEINDILVTALGMAVKITFGNERLLIALEGHGREAVIKDINITRTVGWFTSIYPVLLDFSHVSGYGGEPGLERQLKEVKATLHHVPYKGAGYGILAYLTDGKYKEGIDFNRLPQVSFNYLGQFDNELARQGLVVAEESAGNTYSSDVQRPFEIEIMVMIIAGQLNLSIIYNCKQYKRETVETLGRCYKNELSRIIHYCSTRGKKMLIPSDLTQPNLPQEVLDQLQDHYVGGIEDIYGCTPMQEGMLFHTLYSESSSAYFIQVSYCLHGGELDLTVLRDSLNQLLQRYDILRTAFAYKGFPKPLQVVLKKREAEFYFKDLRHREKQEEQEGFIKEYKAKDRARLFDLIDDSLIRLAVFRSGDTKYYFIWSFHHILMDGWCTALLNAEFLEIYNCFSQGITPRLSPVTPFREYILWLEKQDIEKAKNYWKNFLASYVEPVTIPQKNAEQTGNEEYRMEEFLFRLDARKTKALEQLAAKNRVTFSVVFQAVWGILLAKYNNKQDVVFGVVVSGRPGGILGVESMVGLFINTIPVRIKTGANISFCRLLQKTQQQAINSSAHDHCPLAEIQMQSPLKRDLMNHFLTFLNYPSVEKIEGSVNPAQNAHNGAVNFKISDIETVERSNYNLDVLINAEVQLKIKLRYNTNVYDSGFMRKVANHIEEVVDQVIENDNKKIAAILITHDRLEIKNRILLDDGGDFEL